jgi:ribosomal protein S4
MNRQLKGTRKRRVPMSDKDKKRELDQTQPPSQKGKQSGESNDTEKSPQLSEKRWKDMDLRQRIKEAYPNITDEQLEKELEIWGE